MLTNPKLNMLMRTITITHDNNDGHEYLDRNNNCNTCGYEDTDDNENDMKNKYEDANHYNGNGNHYNNNHTDKL